ncbi:hypothetical protein GWI33_011319, partial [Rhynchophorus ferrugineus]
MFTRKIKFLTTANISQFRNIANKTIDEIVRVDHAGELGADRIYA